MKKNRFYLILIILLSPTSLLAQAVSPGASGAQPAKRMVADDRVTGGIVTLYALDPLARTFCFADGRDGMVVQNNEVRNRCSDIDFNFYTAGGFTVGIEGGRTGAIVELGNADEVKQKYGYEETTGNGQGFASLRFEEGRIVILKDRRSHTVQELRESAQLFQQTVSGANAPVKTGSIYLMRLTDSHDKTFQRIVKFLVIAYTPNESVTIRWQTL